MVVSALAEVVSLSAVVPFIGILASPERIFSRPGVAEFVSSWNITSGQQLVLPLTILFAAAALIAGAIRLLLLWLSTRMAITIGADLSIDVYRRTLYQPYSVHVARNNSFVISGVTNKVNGLVYGVLLPFLALISSTILLLAVTVALVAIDPIVASVATISFGLSYLAVRGIFRRRLRANSECIAREQTQVIKALNEGLGGIRDVLLDGTQPVYCEIYQRADHPLRWAEGNNVFLAQSPRFVMEAFGMVLIAGLAYALAIKEGGILASLPTLGALALGAQRLLPALQQSYSSWAAIAGSESSLANVIEFLDQPMPAQIDRTSVTPKEVRRSIEFRGVRFRYSEQGPWVLDNVNLRIPKGARVGLVGNTGSGKSTTLDLLMGLLQPTIGALLVDGEKIEESNLQAWQKTIAHVPQSIYLADTSFAENIAFGVPIDAIDMDRVRQAARQAQIAEFIEQSPGGYSGLVGERGVRLSGGQRQRIGIARALYKQATVLIFDEATSALDNVTEQSVMSAIHGLDRELTIVMIAHRLSTVSRCDIVVELQQGKVVAQGRFEELLETSASFRTMAQVG